MMLSAGNGFIMQSDKYSRYNAGQSLKKYILLKKGELAYNHGASKAKQFGCCYELLEDEALIPYVYHCFKVDKNEYTPYVAFLLNNPKIDRQLKRLVSSSARMDGLLNISFKDYMSINLSLPPYAEQKQVSDFIKRIDERIVIQEQLISSLKKYKRGSLSALFPKKGEITPQYRFAGFTKPWEQRKLGDVLVLLKDGTHGTHKDAESGPLLLSAKNIKNGTIQWDKSDRRISEDEYNNIHSNFKLQKGDVLLTIVGSIGETAILSQSKGVTFQRSVAFLRPSNKISSEFLYSEIQGQKFQKALNDRKSTSAQPGIYLGDLGTIPIEFPTSDEEQMQIGSYFQNLDTLITLHQHKYDTLLSLKNALLQQLFI